MLEREREREREKARDKVSFGIAKVTDGRERLTAA